MNWTLFLNSLGVSLTAAVLAVAAGFVVALWLGGLSHSRQGVVFAISACTLALPPFLVTNTWLRFFGFTGSWKAWLAFDLYSPGGAILLLILMTWPISLFLVAGVWRRIQSSQLESEPRMRGHRLIYHLLLPHARVALGQAFLISFVIALNQFSIPAILQIKVFPAELWISIASRMDYQEAFWLSLPMILVPVGVLVWISRKPIEWPRTEDGISPRLFKSQLGGVFHLLCGVASIGLFVLSVGLPLYQILSSERTWTEFMPALLAGQEAVLNSFYYAILANLLILVVALSGWKFRIGWLAWLLFLMPGMVLSIGLGWLFNRPSLDFLYGTSAIVIIALTIRYFAICRQGIRMAIQAEDSDLSEMAILNGANRWQMFRYVHWPQISGTALAVGYLVYLFCLWDVETLLMVIPPGGETLSSKIFNLLHYGHNGQVDALCFILLIVAIAPLLAWGVSKRVASIWKSSAIALSLLMICGCGSEAPEGNKLNSRFFSRVEIIGSKGTAPGQFNKPRSVAVDRQDCLYVVDMTGRVQKFSPDGQYRMSWQMPETARGNPKGMYTDSDGNIVVVEPHYSRVNHFSPSGELVNQWGTFGTNVGQLNLPRSIVETSSGDFVVSEYSRIDRLQRFTHDGRTCLNVIGEPGQAPGQFNRPEGMGIDPQDRIYVADSCNHRIQIFTPEGKFLGVFGKPGRGVGEFSYPYDVRIDQNGFQFVCEFGNSRIQVFDTNHQPVEILGHSGRAPGEFFNPWSMAFDSKFNLYVADSKNHRVQKFIRKTDRD